MTKTYILSNKIKGIIEGKRKSKLSCGRCGKSFHVGDVIISKTHGYKTKLYHSQCFQSMFIDLEKKGN